MHIYIYIYIEQASKAALTQFFETLRIEFGSDIGVTLVTPGYIESELTQGKFTGKAGTEEIDEDMRDVSSFLPNSISLHIYIYTHTSYTYTYILPSNKLGCIYMSVLVLHLSDFEIRVKLVS